MCDRATENLHKTSKFHLYCKGLWHWRTSAWMYRWGQSRI